MIYEFPSLVTGEFVKRKNRFVAEVKVAGNKELCHVPNSGRMKELLLEGSKVMLRHHPHTNRKTSYDLYLVQYEGFWVSIDSRLPNKLVEHMVENSIFPKESSISSNTSVISKEPKYGSGRFDLKLTNKVNDIFVECKSVTLVEDGQALFPDAPTKRGKRHLFELVESVKEGYKALIIFLVQRDDAKFFSPNWEMDRDFSNALVYAKDNGVKVESYSFRVTTEGLYYCNPLFVKLD
ncbi:DNA/RNA nuclease SfsA [Natranaerobius trueperi]|uniref:Sugar fermentation stimulation protein homolog n=1 Tax=Natranaerobius trueperi TaxID=759412 RepID=A0A226C3D4_9FIRM|nr:DNA/RNA nuclease SfsA [Natranaerobius trueperi]OWZ84920.1 DNA/RNA nuclease SfsA [Natranaerobius trueperi]